MLSVRDLHAGYGAVEVLHGISLDVAENEVVAILGPNGAGKTSTLRAIVGALKVRGGTVTFLGQDITRRSPDRCARAGISLVPEGRGIFTDLTVAENLRMGGWTMDDDELLTRRVDEVTEIFPKLRERSAQRAGTLSGGEQQQLAIARALVSKPRLLMVDEMSQGLAPLIVAQLFGVLRDLNAAGTTVLLVEQQVGEALALSNRVYVVESGEMAPPVRPQDLAGSGDSLASSYLGTQEAHASREVEPEEPSMEKVLVPLTTSEKRRLQAIAEHEGVSVGEILVRALRGWDRPPVSGPDTTSRSSRTRSRRP